MKTYQKYIAIILNLVVLSLFVSNVVSAQSGGGGTINQLDQFTSTTTPTAGITQRTYGKSLILTGLTASSNLCLDSSNRVTTTGCTGGGSGGSDSNWSFFNNSGIKLATTTNSVLIGASATSTRSQLEVNAQAGIIPFYVGSSSPYFIVGSTGNIGVGTANPTEKLVVQGNIVIGPNNASYVMGTRTSSAAQQIFGIDNNDDVIINRGSYAGGQNLSSRVRVIIGTSKTFDILDPSINSLFTVLSTGNVGVGTSTPLGKLEVVAGSLSSSLSLNNSTLDSNNPSLKFYRTTGSGTFISYNIEANTTGLRFYTAGAAAKGFESMTERFTILNGGNIGIGTTSPTQRLSVVSNASAQVSADFTSAVSNGYSGFNLNNENGSNSASFVHSNSAASVLPSSTWLGTRVAESLHFVTNGTTPRMTITSAGNVGIGSTTPQGTLTVHSGQLTIPAGSSSAPGIAFNDDLNAGIYSSSADNIAIVTSGVQRLLVNANGVTLASFTAGSANLGNPNSLRPVITTFSDATTPGFTFRDELGTGLGRGGVNELVLTTNSVERFRINASGNTGIGTTTPYGRLQVAGTRPLSLLSDSAAGTDQKHWFQSSQGGNFYLGTVNDALTATTTDLTILANGSMGIGSTTPGSLLSVGTTGGINFFENATSTFGKGIDIRGGCFSINGACIGGSGGGGTVTAVTGTWPIISSGGSTPNLTFGGLSTTTALTTGHIPFVSGPNTFSSRATTSVTCSGTVSCTTFDVLGPSPIIITGSAVNSPYEIATTSNIALSQLAYISQVSGRTTLASAATTTLSGNSQIALSNAISVIGGSASTLSIVGDSIGDTQLAFNTGQNLTTASTPTFAGLTVTPLTSAILQTNGSGVLAEYAGTSCTNQFVRSLSALGIATCATVANTDLTNSTISGISLGSNLADLTATNSTLTFSGTYNGGTARTIGLNLSNANTWTVNQTFNYSSSTAYSSFAVSSSTTSFIGTLTGAIISATQRLVTVISAAFTPSVEGEFGADTTSNQWKYFSGGAVRVVSPTLYSTFTYSTSTSWTGTTTIPLGTAFVAETWTGVQCFTNTGTANVSIYDGTNRMNMFNASTTVGTVTLSTNNTWTAGEKRYVDIGTPASTPTSVSCTIAKTITAD